MVAGCVVNKMYVEYSDAGKVIRLVNYKDPEAKTFEIDLVLVEHFYANQVDLSKYNIEYFFNLAKGIVEEVEEEVEIKPNLPHVLTKTSSYNNEITVEYAPDIQGWRLYFRDDIVEKLSIVDRLVFYISKPNDPHYHYGSIDLDLTEVRSNMLEFSWAYPIEQEFGQFSLVTMNKTFKSYGIKDKE